ncbi:acyl-CoA dehydrogenase family protein [Frankia gtarii]|uniref:acyl-CoA dehydrogenase family protein n=1 Tax=Frankia gtarii TaxID=2950102 RepID=UPI0021C169F2|nr:acyl-CoA dehydrogenase family protein [Frankia gtarii]
MSADGSWPDSAAIRAAVEVAGRTAAEADASGRVSVETIEALSAAGFPGCFVPQRWGGVSTTCAAVARAVAEVGTGCASAAWIASLLAYNGRFGAYLPGDGQEEVWVKGPNTRLVSSMVASGVEARPVAGGWSVSGSWLYVSGVEFADWALVSSALPREGDRTVRVFAIPREAFSYENTWATIGMHATGSHTLTVKEAFVPEYRSFGWDDMRQGILAGPATRSQAAPLFSVNGLTFAAPILGAARGAVELVGQHLAVPAGGPRAVARESHLFAFTRAAAEIDAAELLLSRIADTADRGRLDNGLAERSHRDATVAVEILVGAVDRLFRVTGTRGQASSHRMQRIWRDVHAAASHAALQFEPAALGYTRRLLSA